MKKILSIIFLSLITSGFILAQDYNSTALPVCGSEDSDGYIRAFIERIINHTENADIRAEVGLTSVTTSDIILLREPSDNAICNTLNSKNSEYYNRKNEHNIRIYNIVHYKIKNRYFTLVTFNNNQCVGKHDNPDDCDDLRSLTFGTEPLVIYDLNFNELAGWAF